MSIHRPSRRWFVFRAGAPGMRLPGWHATTYDGATGAWFGTWAEALAFALDQAEQRAQPVITNTYSYQQALEDGIVR